MSSPQELSFEQDHLQGKRTEVIQFSSVNVKDNEDLKQSQLSNKSFKSSFVQQDKLNKSNQSNLLFEPQAKKSSNQSLLQYFRFFYPEKALSPQQILPFLIDQQQNPHELQLLDQKITANKVFQKQPNFCQNLHIHSVQPSKNYQVVSLQVQMGYYKTTIVILNIPSPIQEKSPIHSCSQIKAFGAFGKIHLIRVKNQDYAIKCIKISTHNNNDKSFNKRTFQLIAIIKEYFFLKLFSQLGIGPKIKKCFDFDILVWQECAEFSMERCWQFAMNGKSQEDLKQSLRTTHRLKIMHRDIKPNNIMWSEQYKRAVFIDLGSVKFIKQKIGRKSMTGFSGTMAYVSQQMLKVFQAKKSFADLYFNDMYGLSKSCQVFDKRYTSDDCIMLESFELENLVSVEILVYRIKYALITQNYGQFQCLWELTNKLFGHDLEEIEAKLLWFYMQLKPNAFLRQFYYCLSGELRDLSQFQSLKQIYKDKNSQILSIWKRYPHKKHLYENETIIYRFISVYFAHLSEAETRIESELISRDTAKTFLQECYAICQGWNDQWIMDYCVVAMQYCMIANNRFGVSMTDKVAIAQQVISKFQIIHNSKSAQECLTKNTQCTINYLSLTFKCLLPEFTPIAVLYQYGMFKVWHSVPSCLKQTTLEAIISTLSLLGFPFYIEQVRQYVLYQLIGFNYCRGMLTRDTCCQQQDIEKVVLFWEAISLIEVFDRCFHERDSDDFYPCEEIRAITQEFRTVFSELFTANRDQSEFWSVNYCFYQILIVRNPNYGKPANIVQRINALSANQQNAQNSHQHKILPKTYKKWVNSILLIINFLPKSCTNPHTSTSPISLTQSLHDDSLYLHFASFLILCKKSWSIKPVKHIMRVVDETIDCVKISQRFFIELRLCMAWEARDITTVKRLGQIICDGLRNVTVFNFNQLKDIIQVLHWILQYERYRFWVNAVEKMLCFYYIEKIISRAKQYIVYFLTFTHENPLKVQMFYDNHLASVSHLSSLSPNSSGHQKRSQYFLIVFNCLRETLSNLAILMRFAHYYYQFGTTNSNVKKDKYDKTFQQLPYVVGELKKLLPKCFGRSLFLCQESIQELEIFVQKYLRVMKRERLAFGDFLDEEWVVNSQIIEESTLKGIYSFFESATKVLNRTIPINDLQNPFLSNRLPLLLATYHTSKLLQSSHQTSDYLRLIQTYHLWKHQEYAFKILFESSLIQYMINGFVYCERAHSQLLEFLVYVCRVLAKSPEDFAVDVLWNAVREKFECMCKECFPVKPLKWRPLEFIELMYYWSFEHDSKLDPYMAIILYKSILNVYVSHRTRKRFFLLILRSLQQLTVHTKMYFRKRLYDQSYSLKLVQKGCYDPGEYTYDCISIRQPTQIIYTPQIIHREFYYAQKIYRGQFQIADVNQLVEERFRLKRLRKPKWKIPNFVARIYRRKLERYHRVFTEWCGVEAHYTIDPYRQFFNDLDS